MKKISITGGSLLLLVTLILISCKKEFKEPDSPCRLTSWEGLDDHYLRSLHYNQRGLLELWEEAAPLYGGESHFTVEYNAKKQVTKVDYYDHADFWYTIVPVYAKGRIEKELWYLSDGVTLDDEVVNTYSASGQLIKRESLNYAVFASFAYDAIGNAKLILTKGTDGTLYDSMIIAHDKPVREPMNAVPGMPYPIPYLNYIIDKLKYSGFVDYGLSADGNMVKTYEQDDEKSILEAGPQFYAVYYDTFDKVSGVENRQVWHFDNCDCNVGTVKKESLNNGSRIVVPNANIISSGFMTFPQLKARISQLRKDSKTK